MTVMNRIAECGNSGALMPIGNVRAVVIHRTDLCTLTPDNPHPIPDAELDGPKLAAVFRAQPGLGTGCRVPYHCLIRTDATIEQLLPLGIAGAHCIGWNHRSLAVAVVGDFTRIQPSLPQWDALCDVVATWAVLNGGLDIVGHTDVPGGSADPGKRCPGKFLGATAVEMEAFRRIPTGWMEWNAEGAAAYLAERGWTL